MRINKSSTAKGFTLIELLIVIAIIGILAVIVLAILNPQLQRDRARDGIIRSSMTKMAQALGAYYAVHLDDPSGTEFVNEIENTIVCVAVTSRSHFQLEGIETNWGNSNCPGGQDAMNAFTYTAPTHSDATIGCIRTLGFEQTGEPWFFINRNGNFDTFSSGNIGINSICNP